MFAPISESVERFIHSNLVHYIDGRESGDQRPLSFEVVDPSTGSVLTSSVLGLPEDVDVATRAAEAAFSHWSKRKLLERASSLHRFADLLEKNSADLAQIESLNVGKAIVDSESFDIPFGIACVRYFANALKEFDLSVPHMLNNIEARTFRASYGVCGFILPWNFPFDLLLWNIIPAIAAGNTVVVKPSPQTPMSALFMARIARDAGIPDGVINVVLGSGEVACALASHPLIKRMSFTGSTVVGREIGEICGRNLVPVKLELGGKGAAIVFDDTDLDAAAEALATAITFNSGQVCCTATRWLVQRTVRDRLLDKVIPLLAQKAIGPALDRDTKMGPLISRTHFDRVSNCIANGKMRGAVTILDSLPSAAPIGFEGGFYMSPTLLTGAADNPCCCEEVFGPCAFVLDFSDDYDAIQQVNSLSYGLANSVWSLDLDRANRVAEQLHAGNNWINAHNVFAYGLPYRAINKSGHGGGVNSIDTLLDYFRPMTIARPIC